jgi:ATP-binding cassette subfamily C protein CydD
MVLTVAFAWFLSSYITQVFVQHRAVSEAFPSMVAFTAAGLCRAANLWLQEWLGAFAATNAKSELRGKLIDAVVKLGPDWVAKRGTANLQVLITQQLDALDAYFAKFLPQLVFTAIVTPVFTALIFVIDPISGWSLLATLPLIPLFMVLIGWATQSVQNKQLLAMSQLTSHFVEALRGLTTLKVFGRAQNQVTAIAATSNQYRERTMKVLRISFLSGFALELIASLSVALIAVAIGLRLINGDIPLLTGLFVLLLAPEAYLPLRMVGANFHTSAEGVAASKLVLDIIDEAKALNPSVSAPIDFAYELNKVTVLVGPSGAGKTTRLNQLRKQLGNGQVAWLPQRIGLLEGTVLENIVGPVADVDQECLNQALTLSALDDVALNYQLTQDAGTVSGGQAQRIGLARALYAALTSDISTLLLDEPISAQDSDRARTIGENLAALADKGYTVVAVSHQPVVGAHHIVEVARV